MIDINIESFINNIPELLSYIVYGYVYLTAYYWSAFKEENKFNNFIIKSIAVSYILKVAYSSICNHCGVTLDNFILLFSVVSGILGIIIGKIITSEIINQFLENINIGRSTHDNIWNDILRPGALVRVFLDDGRSYFGLYRFCETKKSEPIIALQRYQLLDDDSSVIIDYSNDPSEMVVLNTKNFDIVEITYMDEKKNSDDNG